MYESKTDFMAHATYFRRFKRLNRRLRLCIPLQNADLADYFMARNFISSSCHIFQTLANQEGFRRI